MIFDTMDCNFCRLEDSVVVCCICCSGGVILNLFFGCKFINVKGSEKHFLTTSITLIKSSKAEVGAYMPLTENHSTVKLSFNECGLIQNKTEVVSCLIPCIL